MPIIKAVSPKKQGTFFQFSKNGKGVLSLPPGCLRLLSYLESFASRSKKLLATPLKFPEYMALILNTK